MSKIPNLYRLMYEYKITQKQLAESIGASQSNVSDWLNGKTLPSADKLVALADFFDVTIDYLFGRTDVRTPAAETAQPLTDTARGKLYDELNQLSASDLDELLVFAQFLRYKHGLSKP